MDASCASLGHPSNFFSSISFSSCRSSFPVKFRSNGGKRLAGYPIPFLKAPSCVLLAARRRLTISATAHSQSRRPHRRRNSLRQKLSPRLDQVRLFTEQIEWGSDGHRPIKDADSNRDSGADLVSKNIDFSGKSALRDKLESWVDRYNEDSEFWGIGDAPIFIISEDSDGNIVRVSVDEGEILKRDRIQAWSLEGDEESDLLNNENSKIHRARSIAKEIEAGAYHMPRNSSIAKFVVERKKFSFVSPIDVFSSRRDSLVKIFPRVVFVVSCCLCVLSVVRRFYVGHNDVKLTREQTEMLRRKKKYRMEREEAQPSVQVLQNGNELPLIAGAMPSLDREELMNRIMQAKESRKALVLPDTSGHLTVKDHDFDRKVTEIRQMVRKVHEVEKKSQSLTQSTDEQDELSSILLDSEVKGTGFGDLTHRKEKTVNKSLCDDKNFKGSSHTVQGNSEGVCTNANNNILDKSVDDAASKFSNREPLSTFGSCKSYDSTDIEGQETSTLSNSPQIPVGIDACSSEDSGVVSKGEKQGVAINSVNNRSKVGEETNKSSCVILPSKRGKPKVITSLEEAKEYLAIKCRNPKVSAESEKAVQIAGKPDCNIHTIMEFVEAANSPLQSSNESKSFSLPQFSPGNVISDINPLKQKNKTSNIFLNQVSGTELDKLPHPQDVHCKQTAEVGRPIYVGTACDDTTNETIVNKDCPTINQSNALKISDSSSNSVFIKPAINGETECCMEKARDDVSTCSARDGISADFESPIANVSYDAAKVEDVMTDLPSEASLPSNFDSVCQQIENSPKTLGNRWVEENFQKFDPIIEKMGIGFKENYLLAKEKVQEDSLSTPDISKLGLFESDDELEWMKDENLREIVFQVRENELAGRDPFHLMDANDQQAFFQGLERKVEKANEKLAGVHEWIHSKIENLDYGADGISLDDPLEKIIPRWKGPPIDEDPEFLKRFANIGNEALDGSIRNLHYLSDHKKGIQKSQNLSNSDDVSPNYPLNNGVSSTKNGISAVPKTIVECSDGSSKPGKKNGNEQWLHTKKWSQGFLEVYNAEKDPEVKSILKDMGKDLDRWITDEDRKKAFALMESITRERRKFMKSKMNKLKSEVTKYGAQAVISKYKEYVDEKEEDYLWWLDLKYVLCIEVYSLDGDVPKIGFYSLEMAEDLDLKPKQYHVIAFEDAGDSKNFCHIVQSKMDLLGSGKAFVVGRPPKDVFREAKANGFNVTLIRKGELKLHVDQTLEEVEDELKEVGGKIYHDKIMKERGVDAFSLMKGMIAAERARSRS